MKHLLYTLIILFSTTLGYAQTKVTKKVATKAGGYGVTYSLPKSSLVIQVQVEKKISKRGPYYKYAEKYLGIKNAVIEDHIAFDLNKVTLINKGIPDLENSYEIQFKPGTVAPYVYLSADGLLCAINTEYTPSTTAQDQADQEVEDSLNNVEAVLTKELLMAGSIAKQAEVAAKQIYHIRESKMDILTGDAENLPPDGDAMKIVIEQLENQERSLTSLFTGITQRKREIHLFSIIPDDDLEGKVLFRFSTKRGVLDADDLGGEPITLNLTATERATPITPKEMEKKEKSMRGLVYNVPGKADIQIKFNRETLFKGSVQIVQFGSRESLAPVIFEDRKAPVKVLFYPETGAIKQIFQ